MTELMNINRAKRMATSLTLSFLAVHAGLLALFSRYGVRPMAIFNVFSVLFYIGMLWVVHKGMFRLYAFAVYGEVLAHMTLAAYLTGWNCGFQNTLISMSILLFYSEYASRNLHIPFPRSTPFCLVGMAGYLGTCVATHFTEPRYPLPGNVAFGLQLFWGALVFGITTYYLSTFVKLTIDSNKLLASLVGHDHLTGLPNRYYLAEFLGRKTETGGLNGHWVAMVDIDDFKRINDTYGHNCGDYILRQTAALLRDCPIDMTVCRWGGEEFLLMGKLEEGLEQCRLKLDALRKSITEYPFRYQDTPLSITLTIGLADYREGSNVRDWIGAADQRLYEGKASGKNCVVV